MKSVVLKTSLRNRTPQQVYLDNISSPWYHFSMSTLIDVASEANVSTASVSRFLKNPDSVSSKIAQRIKAAIKKLDYRLDSSAQSLKTGRYYRVRIISPATGPFYWEII